MNKLKISQYAWYAYILAFLVELSWGLFSDTFEVTVSSYIGAALNLPALLGIFGHVNKIKIWSRKIWEIYILIMCLSVFMALVGVAVGLASLDFDSWELWIGPLMRLPALYGLYLYIYQNRNLWQA